MLDNLRDSTASAPSKKREWLGFLSVFSEIWRFARRKPLGAVGAFILIGITVVAIFAPVIVPQDATKTHARETWSVPGTESIDGERTYLLGTDEAGRDNLSRLIFGARISMLVGVLSVALGITAGALLGITSAYLGGAFDLFFQRVIDGFMAFPGIILALAIVSVLGPSVWNVIFALSFFLAPGTARTVRSQALSIKEMDYVLAARAVGSSPIRIIFRHLLPNCFAIYIILASLTLGTAITAEASLGFLGLGVPPTTPTWGGMLNSASNDFLLKAQWAVIAPGVAIALAVYGANLFGDGMRDVLDPRLRGSR